MGPKVHVMDDNVFDTITESSAYWVGCLMADGCVYVGKRGNPRIELTLAKTDLSHLVKFKGFLKCTNPILPKIVKLDGKKILQYSLRFSSKKIAGILMRHGVTPRKSLTARVIGLGYNRDFWRGVMDGDGSIRNKDGIDGDRITIAGSHLLMYQLKQFITHNVPASVIKIKKEGNFSRLFVYSYTARKLAEVLYHVVISRFLLDLPRREKCFPTFSEVQ
jgi:hypothetical protein